MINTDNHKNTNGRRVLLLSILCLFGFCLVAQVQPRRNAAQPAKSKVYLLHADVLKKSKDNPDPDAQILVGNVSFRHDSIYMYCDSACFYEKSNSLEAFDNVKMEQGDTLFLYGDYLFYDGNTQIAKVRNNVRMENRTTTLTTDSLNYDRIANLGYFFDGGTLMDEENVLTSDWGEYSPATKMSVFNYEVELVNPQFTLTSDTLRYNTATKIANIVGPSDIDSDENHIYSELGYYYTQQGQAELLNRSVLTNEGKQLTGDSLFYDRNKGVGEAFFNVEFVDTISKNMLTGNYCYYNQLTSYAFATDKAMAVDSSQGDSLFIHADTLQMYTFNFNTDYCYDWKELNVTGKRELNFYWPGQTVSPVISVSNAPNGISFTFSNDKVKNKAVKLSNGSFKSPLLTIKHGQNKILAEAWTGTFSISTRDSRL